MNPIILTLAIFAFFTVVGYAAVLLAARRPDGSLILLAPTVGTAVVVLPTMLANYLGFPIRVVGLPLALVLLAGSAIVIARCPRPTLPRWYILVALALVVALLLNARPMFVFGGDWMSFMNSDIHVYVHTASKMFGTGFVSPPDAAAYVQQRAMSSTFYARDVLFNRRSGAENVLAFWMSLLGRDGYRTYMPLIVAAHVAQISAATALVCGARRGGHVPVATSLVLACSPLMTLGLDHQLFPQVLGLALLIAALLLLCRPVPIRPIRRFLAMASLSGVVLAAHSAIYPETSPILAAAVFFFYVFAIARRAIAVPSAITWIGTTVAAAAVSLNVHITTLLQMLVLTVSFSSGAAEQSSGFPAYLIPSGLGDLFGFAAITWADGNAIAVAIAAGAAFLVVTLVAMVVLLLRGHIVAFGLLAMALGVPLLFVHQNGFALYKLAMYVQPFLLPTLLSWWGEPSPAASAVPVATS